MHTSKDTLPAETFGDTYEARLIEWGDYTAYFERIARGTDFSQYYDTCAVPHWGYVFKGKLRFTYDDGREEVVSAGEAYYIPPGHKFDVLEDAETVEFSPTREYRDHIEKVTRNLAREAGDRA